MAETGSQFTLRLKQQLYELLWSQVPTKARGDVFEMRAYLNCSEEQALAMYAEYFDLLTIDWMLDRLVQLGATATIGSGVDVILELKLFPAPKL